LDFVRVSRASEDAKDKVLSNQPRSQPVPSFKVRRATVKDIDLLTEHRHAMFDEMTRMTPTKHKVADDPYRNWAKEMMKQRLFRGYIVTTGRGKVAASGCVWLRQVQPSRGRPASLIPYLMSIYTSPKFRRNGLASIIVKESMAWARNKGYGRMTLHASTVGRKVYSQLGWKRTWEMEVDLELP
jgi:GNAT superfamily N-acetyltransferase